MEIHISHKELIHCSNGTNGKLFTLSPHSKRQVIELSTVVSSSGTNVKICPQNPAKIIIMCLCHEAANSAGSLCADLICE